MTPDIQQTERTLDAPRTFAQELRIYIQERMKQIFLEDPLGIKRRQWERWDKWEAAVRNLAER